MARVIDDYVRTLARELSFDRALSKRVCAEIEDHLRDAAEADPAWPSADAEQRAVARFGTPRVIAAQFAGDAVQRQSKRTWLILVVAVLATFLAMRLRTMWIDGMDASALALMVDRYGFVLAVTVAAAGWWLFRRSLLPLVICAVALGVSIAAGIVRADLFEAPLHVVIGTASEVVLLGMLAFYVARLKSLRRFA